MFNTKYIVDQNQNLQINPNANGNAWFVDNIQYVNSPQEEIDALSNFKSLHSAIIYKNDFNSIKAPSKNKSGAITLSYYEPDLLKYNFDSESDQLTVFSEIWYGGNPDWVATIDGKEVPILRANYILRALEIPKGKHEIIFTFRPLARGAAVSTIFSLIGFGLLFYLIFISLKEPKPGQSLNKLSNIKYFL